MKAPTAHYCTKCCGPCESIPFHEPHQEMCKQCGCSFCVDTETLRKVIREELAVAKNETSVAEIVPKIYSTGNVRYPREEDCEDNSEGA